MDDKGNPIHQTERSYDDDDVNLRTIVGFSLGVIGVTILAAALMWWMASTFKKEEEAMDRAPPPLAEARTEPIPPGPRLQPTPPRDMAELRRRDNEALTTYGWVDREHGVAHIPVDRAIDILAERGGRAK
jgi:hypothetical protein